MFDDLFSFAGDWMSGVGDLLTDVVSTVGEAFASVPSTMEGLVSSVGDFGPAASELASEGVGEELAQAGAGELAKDAALDPSNFSQTPAQTIFGEATKPEGIDFGAMQKGPQSLTVDEMIANASKAGASDAPKRGLIESVTGWIKDNPVAARMAGEAVKGAFSPDQIKVARERARAELEAKLQLAQWLKDNNRAGGVGVNLNMRPPTTGAPLQRMTGQPVYSPQGGLIGPYMRG